MSAARAAVAAPATRRAANPHAQSRRQRECHCRAGAEGSYCPACGGKVVQRHAMSGTGSDDPMEREADRAADAVMSGAQVGPVAGLFTGLTGGSAGLRVQRSATAAREPVGSSGRIKSGKLVDWDYVVYDTHVRLGNRIFDRKTKQVIGSWPWMTNNPGDITVDPKEAGKARSNLNRAYEWGAVPGQAASTGHIPLAIFPDAKTGAEALKKLYAEPDYRDKTLQGAIETHLGNPESRVPGVDDPKKYLDRVKERARKLGVKEEQLNKTLGQLQAEGAMDAIVEGFGHAEGYENVGITYTCEGRDKGDDAKIPQTVRNLNLFKSLPDAAPPEVLKMLGCPAPAGGEAAQKKAAPAQGEAQGEDGPQALGPSSVDRALGSPGHALPAPVLHRMQAGFGHDFSRVRVHTDAAARASARQLAAHAYTVGHDIVFAAGQFAPHTDAGQRLIAHELTHVVQQARSASQGVQREGSLMPPEKVQGIYGAWVLEIQKSRGTTVLDDAVEHAVRERVKKQVGPANFANFERWEEAQQARIQAQAEAENPQEHRPKDDPAKKRYANPQDELPDDCDRMWEQVKPLVKEVTRVDGLARKLDFGKGAQGALARATAGGFTATYGLGARSVNSALEHGPMMLLGAGGLVLGSELGERTLVEHAQQVKKEGEELGDDARTGVRLVGGDLQAAFDSTRPGYDKFQAAFKRFSEARSKFIHQDLPKGRTLDAFEAQAGDIGAMRSAMKDMREAGDAFLMTCAQLGIESDAKALDTLGGHIVKSAQDTVATAVMMGAPEAGPGLGEFAAAFKGPEGMGAKALEKRAGEEVAASLGKGGEEALASGEKNAATQATEAVAGGAKGPAKTPPPGEADQIRQVAREGNGVRAVEDPKYAKDYDVEVSVKSDGEPHTYRRKRGDGSWCRFSEAECNFQLPAEDEAAIRKAAPEAAGGPKQPSRLAAELEVPAHGDPSWYAVPQLDAQGRPMIAEAVIEKSSLKPGPRPRNPGTLPAGTEKGVGYEITHVGAHELGFPTQQAGKANLTTASGTTNRFVFPEHLQVPSMRRVEIEVAAAIEKGQTVHYRVTPIYDGGAPYPSAFHMQASGTGPHGEAGIRIDTVIRNWTHHAR